MITNYVSYRLRVFCFLFLFLCLSKDLLSLDFPCLNCNQFLNNQSGRVAEMLTKAKEKDSYWQKNILYLGIILPEFVTQTEFEQIREQALFSTASIFSTESCKRISVGPFQMQPAFMLSIILNSPDFYLNSIANYDKVKKGGVEYIISNYYTFKSLDVQLLILKNFINQCFWENKELSTMKPIEAMKAMSIRYNSGSYERKNIYFKKINCDNRHYSDWADFLLSFFRV